MRTLIVRVAIVLTFLCAATTATASIIAYDNNCPQPACVNQNFGNSLGLDFAVGAGGPIEVLALGMYDGGNTQPYIFAGQDGLSGVTVEIYSIAYEGCTTDCNPTLVPGAVVTFSAHQNPDGSWVVQNGYQIDAENFQNLSSPVTLQPGAYSIVAINDWNWNAGTDNPNAPNNDFTVLNTAGLISFGGSGRFAPPSPCGYGPYTDPTDPCYSVPYPYTGFPTVVDLAPVDRYMAGSFIFDTVPEPSTFGLMGAGLMGAWALRRRRRA